MGPRFPWKSAPVLPLVFQRTGAPKCALMSGGIFTWLMFPLFPTVSGFLRRHCGIYPFSEFNVFLSLCQMQNMCCVSIRWGSMLPPGNLVGTWGKEPLVWLEVLFGPRKWRIIVRKMNGSGLSRKLSPFPCRNSISICFCLLDNVWETSLIFFFVTVHVIS